MSVSGPCHLTSVIIDTRRRLTLVRRLLSRFRRRISLSVRPVSKQMLSRVTRARRFFAPAIYIRPRLRVIRPSMERADVVVVGGGFSGMCAAAALSAGGRRVIALEARTGPDPRFRGELIHPPGVAALASLGMLGPL